MKPNKHLTRARVLKKIVECAATEEGAVYLNNRNPRNLEMMKIAYKPDGYHLDNPGRNFWHKLVLIKSKQFATAQVMHYKNGIVLQASTNEWPLRKELYKPYDTAAFVNLGRVLAQRCLESGIIEMFNSIEAKPNGKVEKFLQEIEKAGVNLTEGERYIKNYAYDTHRMEKSWETFVE